jgi:hypothetical protein
MPRSSKKFILFSPSNENFIGISASAGLRFPNSKHPAGRVVLAACLFGLLLDPEDGGSKFLRNVGKLQPDYTASHPKNTGSVFTAFVLRLAFLFHPVIPKFCLGKNIVINGKELSMIIHRL